MTIFFYNVSISTYFLQEGVDTRNTIKNLLHDGTVLRHCIKRISKTERNKTVSKKKTVRNNKLSIKGNKKWSEFQNSARTSISAA